MRGIMHPASEAVATKCVEHRRHRLGCHAAKGRDQCDHFLEWVGPAACIVGVMGQRGSIDDAIHHIDAVTPFDMVEKLLEDQALHICPLPHRTIRVAARRRVRAGGIAGGGFIGTAVAICDMGLRPGPLLQFVSHGPGLATTEVYQSLNAQRQRESAAAFIAKCKNTCILRKVFHLPRAVWVIGCGKWPADCGKSATNPSIGRLGFSVAVC